MTATMQTDSQNVLEHGQSVWQFTKRLIAGDWGLMKIPDWFSDNHVEIVNNLHHSSIIRNYNIYHDCGKPFCLNIDTEGKRHFPNHAEMSYRTYLEYFDCQITANLIRNDMMLHTSTAEQIELCNLSKKDLFTLLITALAEIHSNAEMFGGIESISFKMKYKKIEQRGRQICKKFIQGIEHKYSYVITRNDLKNAAKTVQSIHVAIEAFKTEPYNHSSVIALVVRNEKKLKDVILELIEGGISIKIFREPLFNNEITAICTEPLDEVSKQVLRRFQLLA